MADKQISQLTAGTIDNNADSFMFDDADGYTYKLPYSDLAGAVLSQSLGAGTGIDITTDSQSTIYKKTISVDTDSTPTQDSQKPVTSGGVYSALEAKQDTLTFDNVPTENSDNPVTSSGVAYALGAKQDALTFDNAPDQGSNNPVTSGGVYTALAAKQNTLTFDSTPTQNSNNPVTSGGVYAAIHSGGGSYTKTQLYDNQLVGTQATTITLSQTAENFDEIEFEYWEYQSEGNYDVLPFFARVSSYFLEMAPVVYVGDYNPRITLQGTSGHYITYEGGGTIFTKVEANTGDTKIIVIRVYGINY